MSPTFRLSIFILGMLAMVAGAISGSAIVLASGVIATLTIALSE